MDTWLTTACLYVLGRPDDRVRAHHELATYAIRLVAAMSIGFGVLAILVSSARQAPPLAFRGVSATYVALAILPLFLAGLHLLYLSIVLRLLVFEVPSHRLRARSVVIPMMLILSYIAYTAAPYRDELQFPLINFKAVSSLLFVSVYVLWAARDGCEAVVSFGSTKILAKFWFFADLAISLFLAADLVHLLALPAYVTAKDVVVAICVSAYFLVHRTLVMIKREEFGQIYSAYLDAMTSAPSKINGDIQTIQGQLKGLKGQSRIAIVDFGSGDGRRLWWFLETIDLLSGGSVKELHIVMYDKLSYWLQNNWHSCAAGVTVIDRLKATGIEVDIVQTASFRTARKAAKHSDIIYASHSVYDARAFREFGKIVRGMKRGSVVSVRGVGASIFRRMSEGVSLVSPTVRNVSYLWSFHFIEVVRRRELEYVTGSLKSSCLTIDQKIDDASALARIGELLRTLYAGEWSERVEGLFHASLKHEHPTGGVNNQDWLLFLRKP